VPFKEATQNVVQQLAGVDRLQVERRFAARLEFQNSLTKKSIRAVAVDAQPAGTVHEVTAKPLVHEREQMRIGNLAVVWSKARPGAFAFNLDAPERRVAQQAIVAREGQ